MISRQLMALACLVLWPTLASAWTLKDVGTFKFEPLANNVYVMHGPKEEPNVKNIGFMNNPAFIISANGLIIVDPGSTLQVGEHVLAEIRKISKKPVLAVFNTHIHGDHWLGNQAIKNAFPDVKIYGHPKMIEQANGGNGANWVDLMSQLTNGLSKGTKVVAPTLAVDNGALIKIEDQSFRIHHLSNAHTDTDIMIEHVDSKTLFLGDNSFVQRMGRFDDSANMHGNIKALQHAVALKLDHYVPGHGQSGSADIAVQPFLTYLEKMRVSVTKGYRAEKPDYKIRNDIIGEFAAYKDWAGFDSNFGKHVNKIYLEIEELEF
ncbi:MAG: MBL fold metallo-hydrolase [Hyphomicrobiaceae bacterium]|nr:MBL fold metallo-hydrolase [Hyphomicrobiaceae bacterium]